MLKLRADVSRGISSSTSNSMMMMSTNTASIQKGTILRVCRKVAAEDGGRLPGVRHGGSEAGEEAPAWSIHNIPAL